MTREMIELVQRACQAWETGDLARFRDLYTPDVTAYGGAMWMETRATARGVEAVTRNFEDLIGAFEQNELTAEGAIETGDRLVVPLLWRGRASGGTRFVEQRLIGVFGFREEKIASMTWFGSLDQALDAVGLPHSAAKDMVVLE
jgi:ketosteroid isomerase-like protein